MTNDEYTRVAGQYVCPVCLKEARDHPIDKLMDENNDPLRRLCDGRLVKT